METQLSRLNPWWEQEFKLNAIPRKLYLDQMQMVANDSKLTLLLGMRRVGKTTLLKGLIERLQKKVNPKTILFVPLDHPSFMQYPLTEIVEKHREIHAIPFEEKIYFFIDEIQDRPHIVNEIKALADHEPVKIYASGSKSLLLKDNKAQLTGRTKTILISPLSFEEFLLFSNTTITKSNTHLYKTEFERYLEFGGIPNYVLEKDASYITDLVDDIIMKDIVAYHQLKNASIIKELFLLICERAGKRTSINKLANILSKNVESIRQYLSFLEETFLIFTIYRHTRTLNERIKSNRKVYIADVGIRNVIAGFKDKGAVFENLVFLKIKDKQPRYYVEDGKEIDFIINDTAIECKYKEKISTEELQALQKSKFKNKLVARNYSFFLSEKSDAEDANSL